MLSTQWLRYRKALVAFVARPGSIAGFAVAAALKPSATFVVTGEMGNCHITARPRPLVHPQT